MKRLATTVACMCLMMAVAGCKSRGVSITEAEQNPVACALLVADTLGDRSEDLLADVALGFAKAGDCERALRLANSFKETEWFRSQHYLAFSKAVTLCDISATCTQNGNQAIAEKAYASALQVLDRNYSARSSEDMWGAYNSLAAHQAERGNLHEAGRLVAELCRLGRRKQEDVRDCQISSWMEVAQKLDAVANKSAAKSFVEMAIATVAESDRSEFQVSVWVKAAKVYFALGENEQATSLLKQALARTARPEEVYDRDEEKRYVIEVFLDAKMFKDAEEAIALLELEYKRSWAWRDFAVKAAETNDCQLALWVSEKISGFNDKADALKAIVKRYTEQDDLLKATEICERIQGYGNRAYARLIVARKYVQQNDLVNAKKFLELAIEDATNESSGSYNSQWDLHLRAASLLVAIGEKERAVAILKEIGKQEISSGSLDRAASDAADDGNYDWAIEIANFVTTNLPCDHCEVVSKEKYKARILVDCLLKHAEAKRKGLDQDKHVPQAVLKNLGLKP